jgi:hypothetical protein
MRRPGLLLPILLLIPCMEVSFGQSAAQKNGVGELLTLHQADRRAHFDHDIQHLLAGLGYELLDVRDGKITHLSREDVRKQFADYFQRSQFTAWNDLEPPIVRVSGDGSMGWMIVRVRITYMEKVESGKSVVQDAVMAWMSAYEKHNGKWTMTAVTSTSAPDGPSR